MDNPVCTIAYMITAFHCLSGGSLLFFPHIVSKLMLEEKMLFCPLHLFFDKLLSVVINNSFQLVLSSLESLYNLSGIGQVTSHHIAEAHHSIGMVCQIQLHTNLQ